MVGSPVAFRRLRALGLVMLGLLVAATAVLGDAARRRSSESAHRRSTQQLVRALGLADLSLSSGARWLRHPTQVEPGAAGADQPASFDVDPAGALLGPARGPH